MAEHATVIKMFFVFFLITASEKSVRLCDRCIYYSINISGTKFQSDANFYL
jgi:hypothetical protein